MEQAQKKQEKILYRIWRNKEYGRDIFTVNGESIEVLDPGVENTDQSGPDFKHARVRINNIMFIGDVEIDYDISDWKSHKHHTDKNYNRVVLHVTLNNNRGELFVSTSEGRSIPTLSLANYIHPEIYAILTKAEINSTGKSTAKRTNCRYINKKIDSKPKLDYLYKLGLERFKKRCDKIYFRLKELSYLKQLEIKEPVIRYDMNKAFISKEFSYKDFESKEVWQQLLYELIFEALGYSKNSIPMLKLAQNVDVNFIKTITEKSHSVANIRAALFSVAGLIPEKEKLPKDKTYHYIADMERIWTVIKHRYSGRYLSIEDWEFFKMRPVNFPTVRISGGAIILHRIIFEDLIGGIIKVLENVDDVNVLTRSLHNMFIIRTDEFWQHHYQLNEYTKNLVHYLVGSSRSDEILVNTILPFFSVYSEVFGYREISKKILNVFTAYEQSEANKILRMISEILSIDNSWKRSIYAQGMIELYRNLCSKNKCYECEIDKMGKEKLRAAIPA